MPGAYLHIHPPSRDRRMPDLACAVCKTTDQVRFQKAGNVTLPLCGNAVACTERYERSRAAGSKATGATRPNSSAVDRG
jgi:uncharacterized Zn finger protein (UPF0148 family)